jgi:hypothetical protein
MNLTKESQNKLSELRDSGKWCCIELHSDHGYTWDIFLTRASYSRDEGEHLPSVISGTYEDLNDAINSVYKKAKNFLAEEGINENN